MILIMLMLRLLWQMYPSLLMCAIFWAMVGVMEWEFIRTEKNINWWSRGVLLAGASMNAIVTLANDGRMPFLGKDTHPHSVWVLGNGKHLLFLCDRFDLGFGILSLGDFFIIGGLLLLLVLRRKPLKSEISSSN